MTNKSKIYQNYTNILLIYPYILVEILGPFKLTLMHRKMRLIYKLWQSQLCVRKALRLKKKTNPPPVTLNCQITCAMDILILWLLPTSTPGPHPHL